MLIGVIADTHDHVPMIDRAIEVFNHQQVQAVIHPGDLVAPFAAHRLLRYKGPIYAIYGNNDGERHGLQRVLPQIKDGPLKLEFGRRRVVVHHFVDCRSWISRARNSTADGRLGGDGERRARIFYDPVVDFHLFRCCHFFNGIGLQSGR